MPHIQAAGSPRPSHRPAPRQTATNVSCTASRTTSSSAHRRRRRPVSQGAWRSCRARSASRSPLAMAETSSASVRSVPIVSPVASEVPGGSPASLPKAPPRAPIGSLAMIEPIDASDVSAWDDDADVVVVGLGCAGACATIEAAETGADVVVLEAAAMGGGTSAMSGGLIYLGGGTAVQEACGYTDTAENMERFLLAACGPEVDEAKVHAYCHDSVRHFHWLVDHGVPFRSQFHPEPSREPPDDSGLVFSGGEDSWPFDTIADPVPRGHHPQFPDAAGGFLMQRLLEAVDQTSARVITDTIVDRLVVHDGRVVGVEATSDGATCRVRARRGVVLTAGGFIFNEEMVRQHCADALRCNMPIGTPFDDGRAIRMGEGVGAATRRHGAHRGRHPVDTATQPGARHPRQQRRAAVHERGHLRRPTGPGVPAPPGRSGLLRARRLDLRRQHRRLQAAVGRRVGGRARTTRSGLPSGSLQATLERYNEHAADRHRSATSTRTPPWLTPLEPPYGVVDMSVDHSYYAPFTLGGLATERGQPCSSHYGRAHRRALRRRPHHGGHRRRRLRERHLASATAPSSAASPAARQRPPGSTSGLRRSEWSGELAPRPSDRTRRWSSVASGESSSSAIATYQASYEATLRGRSAPGRRTSS